MLSMLSLFVCDVIGGFLAFVTDADTWNAAWGFDAKTTVPLPVAAAQLALAWVAARNSRRSVAVAAAFALCLFCLVSVIAGAFDGDLINNARAAGLISWRVVWGVLLLVFTATVGLLASIRAKQLRRTPCKVL